LRINTLVRLSPRGPHGRSATSVQQLELDARRVDGTAHEAAQGVDFSDQMPLRGAANGWVTRHVGHRRRGEGAQAHFATGLRRCPRCLNASVAGANDNNIEFLHPLIVLDY
jgi:hypothetical protein